MARITDSNRYGRRGATQGSVHGGTDFEEMGQTHLKRHSYEPDGSTSSTTAGESLAGLFTAVDTG